MTEIEQLLTRVAAQARNIRPWGWPSLSAPVDVATLDRAETALGFSLPPLLAALYLRIGDGGFGPSYGLLPLLDSPPAGEPPVVAQYLANREEARKDPEWLWPEGILPISHWDCRTPQGAVLLFEPNAEDADQAWYTDTPGLAEWLHTWLDGTGWYEETNDDAALKPWPELRIRTASAQA
ncbi:MAG: SMI1/KNR4 family protein [Streptomyces turgidiscabies]|nr:SMI1/KNR4 family protein [Streptomyces turgidiscabies]